jgi:flagellar biosynthesis protein FlhA
MEMVKELKRRSDMMIGFSVVGIIGVMILPVPPLILDLMLSFSISVSIVILVTSVYIKKPLDFSVFPSVLLMTTLFRLALNVSSTRLILLRGSEGIDAAGEVIRAFGSFVVGGNYVVGFVIFLILITINFIVITKGAGRIAEVAARFTLDGMPGKQMSIDADLNAGLIDEAEARRRRRLVSEEADFYGAMDGASKFVRGDAIAGIIITLINIIGGFIIGVFQKGMPVAEAAKTYTILTIGDGLVSQIPALLISTAAGIIVSRAGSEVDLGNEITKQVVINPKTLGTSAVIMAILGIVPGLPHIPFFILAGLTGTIAFVIKKAVESEEVKKEEASKPKESVIDTFIDYDPLSLEIGYGLIPLVEDENLLLAKIKAMRKQLATELGFVIPSIHIKDNLQLKPHEYSFLIRGIEVGRSEVMMGYKLVIPAGDMEGIEGIPTKEPAFGLTAYWVKEEDADKAIAKGCMVVDVATAIATHITEIIKNHAYEILTRNMLQEILDRVSKTNPKLVEELVPNHITLGGLQRILQNLLKERVPINDMVTILECLLDYAPQVKDVEILTEYVRQALSRYITKNYMNQDGVIKVVTLDPNFERELSKANENNGVVSPDLINKIIKSIEKGITNGIFKGEYPIILCSSVVRRHLRKITERILPSLVILSSSEIYESAKIQVTGVLRYED